MPTAPCAPSANNPGPLSRRLRRRCHIDGELLRRRRSQLPEVNLHRRIHFAAASSGRVYRETVVDVGATADPVTLVVGFRLRTVRDNALAHSLFRCESILNTPLFAGFPEFRSCGWPTTRATATAKKCTSGTRAGAPNRTSAKVVATGSRQASGRSGLTSSREDAETKPSHTRSRDLGRNRTRTSGGGR